LFQKYGLEAEYIALERGTIGTHTLLPNEVQILFTTANLQGAFWKKSRKVVSSNK